jgi:undecaprenyl-diphosphatase
MDWYLFQVLNGVAGRWPVLDLLMCWTARYAPAGLVLPLLYLWLRVPGEERTMRREEVLRAVLAAFLALALNQLIGWLHFRPRPFATHKVHLLLPPSPDPSFPSDHAAGAWAVVWSLRRAAGGVRYPLMALAVAVMVARVYVGLHYPSDVIGGAVVGVAVSRLVERLSGLLPSGLWRLLTRLP